MKHSKSYSKDLITNIYKKELSKENMSKKLPQVKKTLKSFILEDDAKLIDESASKIALFASFLGISTVVQLDDANAKGPSHKNTTTHSNNVFYEGNDPALGNDGDEKVERTYSSKGRSIDVEVNPKQVTSVHANVYYHTNASGGAKK